MPTFQSIPIHPSVRSRLLHPQQQQQQQQANDDGSSSSHHQNKIQQHQQQQQQQPIRSSVSIPRSLLTRDPNDLVDVFSRGDIRNEQQRAGILAQMEGIRSQVAHAMIAKTRNGKRCRALCHQQDQQRNQQQQGYQDLNPLAQWGSMSALHAWNLQQEMLSKNQNNPQIYSTGCRALDDLIAFPAEYFFSPDDSDVAIPYNVDIDSGETKGLPRGYVLKLSGTTGKTQLALQLVAQIITQSSQLPGNDERIRYCYSTAGHSGYSLAQRFFQLIENNNINNSEQRISWKDIAKKIEFQPIATISQLTSTMAKLEEEWLQHISSSMSSTSCRSDREEQQRGGAREKGPVAMLVLDSLPMMLVEREDADRIQSLERWLKRMARHYSVLIVIVTTGGGGSSSVAPDIHLQLQKLTSTTSSVQLMRHPAKSVTEKDCITLLHNSNFGMTTPE